MRVVKVRITNGGETVRIIIIIIIQVVREVIKQVVVLITQ